MSNGWTEPRVRAVLNQYLEIAEVLHDPGVASGLGEQATRRTDETLPYLCGLAIEKADIEQAILYLPWPRLVPAALHWIGGYVQEDIARLEGCYQSTMSRALQQAENEVVRWLVRGCYPDPPRYAERRSGWNLAPVVVGLFCSGGYEAQGLGRWLTDWSLERCRRRQRIQRWYPDTLGIRGANEKLNIGP